VSKGNEPVRLKTNLLALVALLLSSPSVPRASNAPLNRPEILGRLASGSSRSYVAHLVKTRGINFSPTDYYLSLVERAGGTGILLNTLQTARGANTSGGDPPFENLAQCAELLQLGDIQKAESSCREAMAQDPSSPWPLLAIIRCVNEPYQGRSDAQELARRAAALDPGLAEPHLILAQLARSNDEASRELHEAIRLNPEELDVLRQLRYVASGRPPGPLAASGMNPQEDSSYRAILQIEPDYAPIHVDAASFYLTNLQKDQALAEIREVRRLEPDNLDLHEELARCLEWGGIEPYLEDAKVAELKEVARIAPRSLAHLQEVAFECWVKERDEDAIKAFQNVVKVFPENYISTFRMVEIYTRMGRPDDATTELRRFLQATSKDADAHKAERIFSRKQLGDFLLAKNDFVSAATEYKQVVLEDPTDARAHNQVGLALMSMKQVDEAIPEFRSAIQLEPTLPQPHHNLAACLYQQNKLPEAVAEYRTTLAIDPDYPDALNELAWILLTSQKLDLRDPKSALQLARQAVVVLGQEPTARQNQMAAYLDTLAEALLQNGASEEALATETRAIGLDPQNAELQLRLARFRETAQPKTAPQ
jgi:tetratricopeptide (TPR) repeat protein